MKTPRNHRRTYATAAALVLGAALALACGNGSPDTGDVGEGTEAPPAPAETSQAPKVARMGKDTVTFENKVAVMVKAPKKFTPSSTSAGHQVGNTAVVFDITITNGSSEPIDLALVTATAALGADGTQAAQVYDSEHGITGFEGVVAKGQKRTAKLAFSAPTKDTSKIALTVAPSFLGGETALFEGKI